MQAINEREIDSGLAGNIDFGIILHKFTSCPRLGPSFLSHQIEIMVLVERGLIRVKGVTECLVKIS